MNAPDRMTGAGAGAVLLAASALIPIYDGPGWIPRTVVAVAVVAVAGALSRRAAAPTALQPLVGLLALLGYCILVFAGSTLHHFLLPGADTVTALRGLLQVAVQDVEAYAPPVPATEGLVLLTVLGVGAIAVLVDAAAVTARRAAVAGLPLLLLFAVPSAVLPGGLGWWPFALGAAGWLGMLLVEDRERVGRWGTPLQTAAGQSWEDPAGAGRVGRRIGAAALGVAVIVPAVLPGLNARLLDGGAGGGGGAGDGSRTVTTYNPITRLRGQLQLPEPVDVLRYTTDDPAPDYLRLTTLGVYDGDGWRQDVLNGTVRENGVDDPLPVPEGRRASTLTLTVQARIDILDLDAPWLPTPVTPSQVTVDGPWLWDEGSESVFATRSDTTKVEPYLVRASRVLPDPDRLAPGSEAPEQVQPYAEAIDATAMVRALTERVIRGAVTDYDRAAAIQAFFRDPAQGFAYSEQTQSGGNPDALEDFLANREGFCEQYASAMAAMLRLAGVPSRVAVGFTPGTPIGDGYVVTTDNAHAWPEAWFDGAGWIRFEPTPSAVGGIQAPGYASVTPDGDAPVATPPDSGATSAPGTNSAESLNERRERLEAEARAAREAAGEDVAAPPDRRLPVKAAAIGAGVLLLLGSPALLHMARRRARWRSGTAVTAWEQVRDDAADTGHRWDPAESPRQAAARLIGEHRLADSPAQAVARLAAAVEHRRYAPPGRAAEVEGLQADSTIVRHGLHAGASRWQRLRVLLLPPSTVRWAGALAGSRTADLLDGVDGGLAKVGRRLRRRRAA